jgi:hypothetical protein
VKLLMLVIVAMAACKPHPHAATKLGANEIVIAGTAPIDELAAPPPSPPPPAGLAIQSYTVPHEHGPTWIDGTQDFYAATGAYVGHHSDNGDLFDSHGAYAGRIDPSDNLYDRTGALVSRLTSFCDAQCRAEAIAPLLVPR